MLGRRPSGASASFFDDDDGAVVVEDWLTETEQAAYAHVWSLVSGGGGGVGGATHVVAAPAVVPVLRRSKLSPQVLSQIWHEAQANENVDQLIALYQSGSTVSTRFITAKTPLPVLDGVVYPAEPALRMSPQTTGSSLTSLYGASPWTDAEVGRFVEAFSFCRPIAGVITGDSAKAVFERSGLTLETLSKIWILVDPQGTLQLSMNQFFAAMYLITRMKSGALAAVPDILPPDLWTAIAAATSNISPIGSASMASPVATTLPSPLAHQQKPASVSSISNSDRHRGHLSIAMTRTVSAPPSTSIVAGTKSSTNAPFVYSPSSHWAISVEERAAASSYFEQLDSDNKQFVTGEECLKLFLKSKLSSTVLAKVWDLSDINKAGRLTRDEFTVAMHLIKMKVGGVELPDRLPAELMPPGLRNLAPQSPSAADSSDDPFGLELAFSDVPSQAPLISVATPSPPASTRTTPASAASSAPFGMTSSIVTKSHSVTDKVSEINFKQPTPLVANPALASSQPIVAQAAVAVDSLPSLSDLSAKTTSARAVLSSTNSKISAVTAASMESRASRLAAQAELDGLRREIEARKGDLERARMQAETEEADVAELRATVERFKAALSVFKRECEDIETRVEFRRVEREEAEKEVERLRLECEHLRKRIAQARAVEEEQLTLAAEEQAATVEAAKIKAEAEAQSLRVELEQANAAATAASSLKPIPIVAVAPVVRTRPPPPPPLSPGQKPFSLPPATEVPEEKDIIAPAAESLSTQVARLPPPPIPSSRTKPMRAPVLKADDEEEIDCDDGAMMDTLLEASTSVQPKFEDVFPSFTAMSLTHKMPPQSAHPEATVNVDAAAANPADLVEARHVDVLNEVPSSSLSTADIDADFLFDEAFDAKSPSADAVRLAAAQAAARSSAVSVAAPQDSAKDPFDMVLMSSNVADMGFDDSAFEAAAADVASPASSGNGFFDWP